MTVNKSSYSQERLRLSNSNIPMESNIHVNFKLSIYFEVIKKNLVSKNIQNHNLLNSYGFKIHRGFGFYFITPINA